MAYLQIQDRKIVLSAEETLIGRAPTCAIRIEDERVSRVHCAILHSGDTWFLETRGAANAILVNDVEVSNRVRIHNEVCIMLGRTKAVFYDPDEQPPTAFGPTILAAPPASVPPASVEEFTMHPMALPRQVGAQGALPTTAPTTLEHQVDFLPPALPQGRNWMLWTIIVLIAAALVCGGIAAKSYFFLPRF